MLYLSRLVGQNDVGVVDTDDYVEQIISRQELYILVGGEAVDIEGVKYHTRRIHGGRVIRVIDTVDVYQDRKFIRPIQTKWELLNRVSVRTFGSMITAIRWDFRNLKKDVPLRLSDFGDSLADRILTCNIIVDSPNINLILDDRVKVSRYSFMNIGYMAQGGTLVGDYGVTLDISGVTDEKAAELVYRACADHDSQGRAFDVIIDQQDRKMHWMRVLL